MTTLADRIRTALDETERDAHAALRHPMDWDPASRSRKPIGTDDGVWKASGYTVDSANIDHGGGIFVYNETGCNEGQAVHIARHDPASVLRMVAAHRKLLDWLVMCEGKALDNNWWNLDVNAAIELLAEAYGVEA